ncbi:MAG: RHS repeat-associated core domain-containing protein [Phycisphaerales bacterium]|nr:RHS repeat-associated core domain-containing protein [Phycisphaerales bacterium]
MPQPVEFEYNTTYGHLFKMRTYRSGDFTQSTWPSQPPTPDETRWDRDGVSGLLTRKVYPDTTQVKYVYNDYSALKSRDWARGPISIVGETSYTYDPDTGQLTNIDYTDATPDIAFTYDRLGRIATVTDALGTHTFTYNAKLQLESEEIAGSIYDATITRTYQGTQVVPGRYDGFGIGMDTGNWNDDFEATYLFDTHGRLNHVSGTALPNCGVRYSYLTNSDLIERIEYEANLTTFAETVRSYESTRDLLTSVENKWGTTVISKYDYAYDNLRRRTSVINGGKAFVDHSEEAYSLYSDNDRNELTRSQRFEGTDLQAVPQVAVTGQDFEYQYDPIGNRTESSIDQGTATDYTTNNVNQYTATANPAETFTYDADGNMTADDDLTYTYNMENRLVSVSDSQGTILEFTYDYRGRRVRKVEHDPDPVNGGVIEDTRFVYDDWNVVLELDGQDNNAILRKYAWGLDLSGTTQGAGGIGGLLAVQDTDGTVVTTDDTPYLYFYDGHGNVGQLMDFSDTQTLTIAAHYEYDPYGNALVTTGSYASTSPFQFSTKYFDEETGFYYYNNRFYTLRLGRWLNRDPVAEHGDHNLYRFVQNNALSWIDPDGYQPQTGQPTSGSTTQPTGGPPPGWEPNPGKIFVDPRSCRGKVDGIKHDFQLACHRIGELVKEAKKRGLHKCPNNSDHGKRYRNLLAMEKNCRTLNHVIVWCDTDLCEKNRRLNAVWDIRTSVKENKCVVVVCTKNRTDRHGYGDGVETACHEMGHCVAGPGHRDVGNANELGKYCSIDCYRAITWQGKCCVPKGTEAPRGYPEYKVVDCENTGNSNRAPDCCNDQKKK